MKEREVLTTGEVAKYCGVNFRTVIRWIDKGYIKAYRLPGRGDNRIEVKEFVEFLKKNEMPLPKAFQSPEAKDLSDGKHRILVVDDDLSVARSIARILKKSGYETEIATDGFAAGAMTMSFNPHLVTLDLNMPGVNGFEVLRLFRQSKHMKTIKVIVISALERAKLDDARKCGADDCIEKPFSKAHLLEKVRAVLGDTVRDHL